MSTVRRLGVIAAVIVGVCIPSSAVNAAPTGPGDQPSVSYEEAVPGRAPTASTADAVYLDAQGNQISESGELPGSAPTTQKPSARAAAIGCTPGSGRDNPHYSSGDVSGHGWWTKGSCTSATAHVQNCLYEYFTDNTWRQKACSAKEKLKPYTGSGQRTVARARCNPTAGLVSWRNHVDVDVDGQIDTGENPMNQAQVNCHVS